MFLAQALANASSSPVSEHIVSPLKSNSHKEIHAEILNTHYILPHFNEQSTLLSEIMIKQLIEKLPNYLKYRDWDLIYSTETNGWSLNTFYRNCENYGSNILIIKDEGHFIFGGFANQSWIHSRKFYGNGECFLFSFEDGEVMKYYHSSLENEFYMSSDLECLIMGGG